MSTYKYLTNVELNAIYKCFFEEPYDVFNGVYRFTEIMTYEQITTQGIDLQANIFTPAEVDSYDLTTLEDDVFYRIERIDEVPIDDEPYIRYMPASFFSYLPDPNIQEYERLMLGIDIGLVTDINEYNKILSLLRDILETNIGISFRTDELQEGDDPDVVSLLDIQTYSTEWKSDSEINAVRAKRQAVIASTDVNNQTANKITNWYKLALANSTLLEAKDTQIAALQAKVDAQNILIQHLHNEATNQ